MARHKRVHILPNGRKIAGNEKFAKMLKVSATSIGKWVKLGWSTNQIIRHAAEMAEQDNIEFDLSQFYPQGVANQLSMLESFDTKVTEELPDLNPVKDLETEDRPQSFAEALSTIKTLCPDMKINNFTIGMLVRAYWTKR